MPLSGPFFELSHSTTPATSTLFIIDRLALPAGAALLICGVKRRIPRQSRDVAAGLHNLLTPLHARNVGDVGRYLLNIQRASDTFTTVSITSQMPGWPPNASGSSDTTTPIAPMFGPGGPYGAAPGGFGAVASAGTSSASGPTLLNFPAVGQLTQPFQFAPPVYAEAGTSSTDTTGGGGGCGAPPGGGFGPTSAPGGPGPGGPGPGGGANGGGANGGGT